MSNATQGSKLPDGFMEKFGGPELSQQGTQHRQTGCDQTETCFDHAPIQHGCHCLVKVVTRVESSVRDNYVDYHACNGSSDGAGPK